MRIIYQPGRPASAPSAPPIPIPALVGCACSLFVLIYTANFMLALVIIAYGIFFAASTRRKLQDPFETDVIYLLYFGFYCVVPLVLSACKPDRFDQRLLDPQLQIYTMISMLGVFVGMQSPLFRRLSSSDLGIDGAWDPREAKKVAWGMMALGLVLLALLIQTVGISTYLSSRYVDIYVAERGKGYLVAGIFLIEIGILVLALSTAEFRKRLNLSAFAIGLFVCLCYLRIGRRGVVLSIGVGLLLIYHFFYKPIRWKAVGVMVIAAFAAFVVVGQARAYSEQGWEGMVAAVREDLVLEDAWGAFMEPNSVQVSFREVMQYIPAQSPYRWGMSYIEGFEALIPEKIHPDRPLTSSQWFAYFYDPQTAAQGGGFSFSIFAEGYMNFGLIGVLLVGVVEGALVRRCVEFRWAAPANKSRLLIVAAVATQLPYFIRGEFASMLKQNLVIVLVPTLVAAAYLGRRKKQVAKAPMRVAIARAR